MCVYGSLLQSGHTSQRLVPAVGDIVRGEHCTSKSVSTVACSMESVQWRLHQTGCFCSVRHISKLRFWRVDFEACSHSTLFHLECTAVLTAAVHLALLGGFVRWCWELVLYQQLMDMCCQAVRVLSFDSQLVAWVMSFWMVTSGGHAGSPAMALLNRERVRMSTRVSKCGTQGSR